MYDDQTLNADTLIFYLDFSLMKTLLSVCYHKAKLFVELLNEIVARS